MILIAIVLTSLTPSKYTIDFGEQKDGQDWMIVNDGVMGGLSDSKAELRNNSLFFEGHISLENNGGFASLRKSGERLDISTFQKVNIRFKSKGRTFALRLTSSDSYWKPFFKQEFESTSDDWEILEFNLADFKEYTINGETGNKLIPETETKTFRLGIILFDKKEGPFEIEIDYIEFI